MKTEPSPRLVRKSRGDVSEWDEIINTHGRRARLNGREDEKK